MRSLFRTFLIIFLGLGVLSLPLFAASPDVPDGANYGQETANPGTLNYVEGTAHLEGRLLKNSNVGGVTMEPGQVLTTQNGRAEILLMPGVYLRVGDHSAVKMISPDITFTQVKLVRGEAGVEVDETYKGNDLGIVDGNVSTWLIKKGFYEFTTNPARVRVFKGEAAVEVRDGKYKKVKSHHEMALAEGARQKARNFNVNDAQDELYQWSKLRSQYQAEAYNQMQGEYGGWDGYGPGWYWNPYMMGFAYGGGPFWSPFGWGPGYWGGWGWGGWGWGGPWWGPGFGFYGSGFYPGFYGGGFYGGGFYGGEGFRGSGKFHSGLGAHGGGFNGRAFHGGLRGGAGFHGGATHGGGFQGGGFRGGGGFHAGGVGVFHGGGFHSAGGFHGGGRR